MDQVFRNASIVMQQKADKQEAVTSNNIHYNINMISIAELNWHS